MILTRNLKVEDCKILWIIKQNYWIGFKRELDKMIEYSNQITLNMDLVKRIMIMIQL